MPMVGVSGNKSYLVRWEGELELREDQVFARFVRLGHQVHLRNY